jgi:hypothetical protein
MDTNGLSPSLHNSLLLVPILMQTHPIDVFLSYFFSVRFTLSSCLCLGIPSGHGLTPSTFGIRLYVANIRGYLTGGFRVP